MVYLAVYLVLGLVERIMYGFSIPEDVRPQTTFIDWFFDLINFLIYPVRLIGTCSAFGAALRYSIHNK